MHFKSEKGRKELIEYNKKWTDGRAGFPNIDVKKLKYGSLAGSHLGLAVRCAHQRMKTPLGLDLADVVENDAKLKKIADEGLEYLVLKEDTPLDAQRDISAWRNQDQNSNLAFHEFALIQTILDVAAQEAERTKGKCPSGL